MLAIDLTNLDTSCFNGAYKEFAEVFGVEITLKIHEHFGGQCVSFPKKILADSYLHRLILTEHDGTNSKHLARKYNYTHSWVMKLIRRNKACANEDSIEKEVRLEYSEVQGKPVE